MDSQSQLKDCTGRLPDIAFEVARNRGRLGGRFRALTGSFLLGAVPNSGPRKEEDSDPSFRRVIRSSEERLTKECSLKGPALFVQSRSYGPLV